MEKPELEITSVEETEFSTPTGTSPAFVPSDAPVLKITGAPVRPRTSHVDVGGTQQSGPRITEEQYQRIVKRANRMKELSRAKRARVKKNRLRDKMAKASRKHNRH